MPAMPPHPPTPQPDPPAVVVHLGAHKTASTHLQLALKRARGGLAGVRVFVPDDLRRDGLRLQDWLGLAAAAPAGRDPDPAHAARLRTAFAGPGRLLISEENILGQVPGPELGRDGLYPQAGPRLARLAGLLPEGPVTLALGLREGAGFLASCHTQALMAGRLAPFAAGIGAPDPAALDWEGLASRLMAAVPGARLVIWDHADWPAVWPAVAAELLGPGEPPPPLSPGRAHPGLTAPAVAALMAEAPADPAAAQARARALRAAYPREAGYAPFDPWPPGTAARARSAMAAVLVRLAARPGVRVLRPRSLGGAG